MCATRKSNIALLQQKLHFSSASSVLLLGFEGRELGGLHIMNHIYLYRPVAFLVSRVLTLHFWVLVLIVSLVFSLLSFFLGGGCLPSKKLFVPAI